MEQAPFHRPLESSAESPEIEASLHLLEDRHPEPVKRLAAVFDMARAWDSITGQAAGLSMRSGGTAFPASQLKNFLLRVALEARARDARALADQLLILLQGAISEASRDPRSAAIDNAGKAAMTLLAQACRKERSWVPATLGWTAAAVVTGIAFLPALPPAPSPAPLAPTARLAAPRVVAGPNPDSVYAVLALQELIDKGACPAPELLALPPGQVTAYMNIIHFRTPDDPVADREHIRAFLAWFERTRARECYERPSNGHTGVAWVSS